MKGVIVWKKVENIPLVDNGVCSFYAVVKTTTSKEVYQNTKRTCGACIKPFWWRYFFRHRPSLKFLVFAFK